MKKTSYYLLWFLFICVLRGILGYIKFWSVLPNISLVFVVITALENGSVEGGIVGVVVGFLADLIYGRVFGVSALISMYIGVFCGLFCYKYFRVSFASLMIFVLLSTVLHGTSFAIFNLKAVGLEIGSMFKIIIQECLCNIIISVPLYYLMHYTNRKWLKI